MRFDTKPILARRLIDRPLDAVVPGQRVTADAVYGSYYISRLHGPFRKR